MKGRDGLDGIEMGIEEQEALDRNKAALPALLFASVLLLVLGERSRAADRDAPKGSAKSG